MQNIANINAHEKILTVTNNRGEDKPQPDEAT